MKRLIAIAAAFLVAYALLVPVARAADPFPHTGRVLISTGGDVILPAGEHADAVVVVNGTATIEGEVNTILVVDGAANLVDARAETVVAIRSPIEIGPGSVVQGDVMKLDSVIHQTGSAEVLGEVTDISTVLVGVGAVLAPALFLLWIGFGLATIVAGLLLAGLAARQVRAAEALISREPVQTFATGIVGLIVIPLLAILLIGTLVGAPLGLGLLLGVLPFLAFLGYLVAGIWIGEWTLRRLSAGPARERPYAATFIGILVLEIVAIVPILSIVTAIASLFGFGAVILLALRTLGSREAPQTTVPGAMSARAAG